MNFFKRKELTYRSYWHGEESTDITEKKAKYSIELRDSFNKKIAQFNNNLSKMLHTHVGNIQTN